MSSAYKRPEAMSDTHIRALHREVVLHFQGLPGRED